MGNNFVMAEQVHQEQEEEQQQQEQEQEPAKEEEQQEQVTILPSTIHSRVWCSRRPLLSLLLTPLSLFRCLPSGSSMDSYWGRSVCVGKQVEEQESQEEAGQVNEPPLFPADWIASFCVFAGVCVLVHVHVLLPPVWKVAEWTLYRELFSVLVRKP